MDRTTLDQMIADTLVEDYGWREEQADAAVVAWRGLGSPDDDGDAVTIAERIFNTSSDAE
jgi:hypothetical protein